MDDSLDRVLRKDLPDRFRIAHVSLRESRPHARDGLDAVHDVCGTVGQVVRDDDVKTGLYEFDGGMRADKARAAR